MLETKVAFITGGAKRIGAALAHKLHAVGMNLAINYNKSETAARALQTELNNKRPNSVILLQGSVLDTAKLSDMIQQIIDTYGRLDVLINNASTFYPTSMGQVKESEWEDLFGTNLKAPFFLSQAAAPYLTSSHGCIINLVDIHGKRPKPSYPVYCSAKAGLIMLTKALALELAPNIRVNGIAPGTILWPDEQVDETSKQEIIAKVALKRHGSPEDIAKTALFLIRDAPYITGQIIPVDGGRSLNQ